MTFESTYQLLLWYFNKRWLMPPKSPGDHDMVYIGVSSRIQNVQDIWDTVQKIKEVISQLPSRDRSIMEQLFTSTHPADVAKQRGVSERRIRQIRSKTVSLLEAKFQEKGLLEEDGTSEPIYAKE